MTLLKIHFYLFGLWYNTLMLLVTSRQNTANNNCFYAALEVVLNCFLLHTTSQDESFAFVRSAEKLI